MERQVVFITGSGHSGSTLLALMLGSHSQTFGVGEIADAYKAFRSDRPESRHVLCQICEGPCSFWNQRVDLDAFGAHFATGGMLAAIKRRWADVRHDLYGQLIEASGKDVLIDSSKTVSWIQRQLQFRWHWKDKKPFVLWITRDGRAVVNSYLRKYPERGVQVATEHWKDRIEQVQRLYDAMPPERRAVVAYESMATDPDATIARVCEQIGIPYEADMLKYWRHDHHMAFGNMGTRSLIHRYRKEELETSQSSLEEVSNRHGEHYDRVGLAIKLDLRWKNELSADDLRRFEQMAGRVNEPFTHE